jgi:hypothetical protein
VRVAISKRETKLRFNIDVTDYCPSGFPETAVNYLRNQIFGLKVSDCRNKLDEDSSVSFQNSGKSSEGRDVMGVSTKRLRSTSVDSVAGGFASATLPIVTVESTKIDDNDQLPTPPAKRRKVVDVSEQPLGIGKGRSSGTGLPHLLELYNRLSSSGEDFNFALRLNSDGTTMKLYFEGFLNAPATVMESDAKLNEDICNMRGKRVNFLLCSTNQILLVCFINNCVLYIILYSLYLIL